MAEDQIDEMERRRRLLFDPSMSSPANSFLSSDFDIEDPRHPARQNLDMSPENMTPPPFRSTLPIQSPAPSSPAPSVQPPIQSPLQSPFSPQPGPPSTPGATPAPSISQNPPTLPATPSPIPPSIPTTPIKPIQAPPIKEPPPIPPPPGPGPAQQALEAALAKRPQMSDPEFHQGKMRTILNAIAGGLAGLRSPEEGVRVGHELRFGPYERAVEQYKGNVASLQPAATAEDERVKRGLEEYKAKTAAAREEAYATRMQAWADSLTRGKKEQWKTAPTPEIDPDNPDLGPQTVWYDINDPTRKHYGGASVAPKPIAQKPNVHVLPSGEVVVVSTDEDGKSTAEMVYKGKPGLKTEVKPIEVGGKPHQVLFNATTGEMIKDLGPSGEKAKDFGVTMVTPEGQVGRFQPGQTIPPGSGIPSQFGPTQQMRNVGAQAQIAHSEVPRMLSDIDRLQDKLGPLYGRWNEFIQGRIGLDDPDMAGLRADLLMYSSAVALMHARGRLPENLRQEFDNMINAPKQTPENLKSVLNHVDVWTAKNIRTMGGQINPPPPTNPSTPPPADNSGKVITGTQKSTGKPVYSNDGGKTWLLGAPPKK